MKKPARNAASMKLGNMLEIIDIVRRGPVSRADVARATGLTRAAVTIIADRLGKEGILAVPEAGEGSGPAKNKLLAVRDDSFYFMGVDITRVNCSVCVANIRGKSAAGASFGILPDAAFDDMLPVLLSNMKAVCKAAGGQDKLTGIGVSVPGPVDSRSGVVLNPQHFKMMENQRVLDRMKGEFGCGMWLDNNAAARTLYEKNLGAGRRFDNLMALIVDTGVGSGLILDGKLFRGSGFAGEAGHTSIDMDGPLCTCGNRGCLEGYAAIPALLRRECAGRPDIASWTDVVDKAQRGDALCLRVVEREARYIAQCIVNTANLLDLEAVILMGYVAYKPELLMEGIRRAVRGIRITERIHKLEILASANRENAGAVSAAAIAMEKFFAGETGWNIHTRAAGAAAADNAP
jgi:predicted NBD/HSP70 family sugar kinase